MSEVEPILEEVKRWKGTAALALFEVEKLKQENERLTRNAETDAKMMMAYNRWCHKNGCPPSSSDLMAHYGDE